MDVESYREKEHLTYKQLSERLKVGLPVSSMRRIALGYIWPRAHIVDTIVAASGGEISVASMHQRYSAQRSAAA
jgi:hypothetical protein